MSIITSSIRFPVTVAVVAIIAVLGGLLALFRVPIQLTPDVEKPYISVQTNWFGASPEEIEKEIILEQEKYLKSVEGLVKMTSESHDGYGSIALEFPVGADLTEMMVRVNNQLQQVPSYPDNVDQPIVTTTGPFEGAVAWFVVTAKDTSQMYVPYMQTVVEELVQPRMERVQGVAKINLFGGLEDEVHVDFDPQLLASSGITVNQLVSALRQENRDVSAGDFSEGKRRYVVRTLSRYEHISDVEETIVAMKDGAPIRVKDLATVSMAHRKPVALVRHLGRPAIAFNAQRQVGSNVLEVLNGLLKTVDEVNEDILEPRGMHVENVYRETVYINSAIDLVFSNLYVGSALAILVLFLFLRSISSILVIGISIPISIVSAFLTMFLFGRTINVISLAGMAFAAGMVVDNAIVVLENIYRHMQMGKNRWQASSDATKEVWGAVLASTVTTIAVFLPILFLQEQAAQIFKDIAIAISTAIGISLIVSVTVIPTLSSKVLRLATIQKEKDFDDTRLGHMARRVAMFVDYLNAKVSRRLIASVSVVVLTIALSLYWLPSSEYLPEGNQNLIFGFMLPPPGYNLDEMLKYGEDIEDQFRPLWNAPEDARDSIPGGGIDNFFFVAFPNQAFMGMVARDPERVKELLPMANGAVMSIPGAYGFASQASLFSRDFAGSRSVQLDISGPDLPQVLGIAGRVFGQVSQVLPGAQGRPIPGLDLGNPEVRVTPDRVRAADVGMSAGEIGTTIDALVDGMIVSNFRHEGRDIDLLVRGSDKLTEHTQDIAQLPFATPTGQVITVGDVADVTEAQGPLQINHVERQRTVSIQTTLPSDIPLEDAMNRIEEQIVKPLRQEGVIGGLYDIKLAGTADELTKLKSALSLNFLLAIILTFLLLAALFQSFVYPIVIMVTVPLATFGGVVGLRIIQLFWPTQTLDVLTMLGFVILIGTVVNNSILIVHQALNFMREGWDDRSAVKESVRIRVRPILMSTMTSVFGMVPLVIMPGAGSELYRGLGSVVIGGLAFSTVVTLAMTPLVFSFAIDVVKKIRGMLGMDEVAVTSEPDLQTLH